jgi:hypothetical protein
MDELDKRLDELVTKHGLYVEAMSGDDLPQFIIDIKKTFKDAGYIKLPGNAQNVTITTSDNTHDGKLMTEQEWREKFNG